jgi:hypothetical protein
MRPLERVEEPGNLVLGESLERRDVAAQQVAGDLQTLRPGEAEQVYPVVQLPPLNALR